MEAEESLLSPQTVGAAGRNGIHDNIHTLEERILINSFPICMLGVIGNALVLWLLFCKIKIKLSLYFVCLTVANIIISFCNIVIFIYFLIKVKFGLMFQRIMHMLHLSSYDTGFYIFTALIAERWFALYFPAWYKQHRANYFSAIMCFSLWGFSWLVSFLDYYACFPRHQINFHNVYSCKMSTTIEITTEFLIFLPSMLFFTLGIWIKMIREGAHQARLDITIVAMVLVFLTMNVPLRLAKTLIYWDSTIDGYMLGNICFLLDSIYSTTIPFIYLVVGFWKTQKRKEPCYMFLERALSGKQNIVTPTGQEQT